MRTILALLLMSYSLTTTSAGLEDYLYQPWNAQSWSCTTIDKIEGTCNLQLNLKWRKK